MFLPAQVLSVFVPFFLTKTISEHMSSSLHLLLCAFVCQPFVCWGLLNWLALCLYHFLCFCQSQGCSICLFHPESSSSSQVSGWEGWLEGIQKPAQGNAQDNRGCRPGSSVEMVDALAGVTVPSCWTYNRRQSAEDIKQDIMKIHAPLNTLCKARWLCTISGLL